MADASRIEWVCGNDGSTGATWNPVAGCSKVSAGCKNCYAIRMAVRLASNPSTPQYHGTIIRSSGKPTWSGVVNVAPDHVLTQPLRWRKPRRIFVNSMSDLFHEAVPDEALDRIFAVMALCPQHTFIVLTKRPERMREYLDHVTDELGWPRWISCAEEIMTHNEEIEPGWPLPNLWLGVSVEDQDAANTRIPALLATPAAVRFVSAEPLLGPVRFRETLGDDWLASGKSGERRGLDWIIVGGESGSGARSIDHILVRSIRDQCHDAGVAFFMKQMSGVRKSAMPPIPDDLMIREFPR